MNSNAQLKLPGFLSDAQLRLIWFGGKGGTGKTTCSTATALSLASANPRNSYLLLSTDPAHSLSDCMKGITPPPGLHQIELDADHYLTEFKNSHRNNLEEIARRGTFLDDEDIRSLLDLSLPGLDELVSLLEIADWVDKKIYDTIIIDTAPTGHTLRLLEMPVLINSWLQALDTLLAKHRYMKKVFSGRYQPDSLDEFLLDLDGKVKRVDQLLKDHRQTRFIPVTIAEELGLAETKNLLKKLNKLEICVKEIIINRLNDNYPNCPICHHRHTRQQSLLNSNIDWLAQYPLWGVSLRPEPLSSGGFEAFWQNTRPWSESASVGELPTSPSDSCTTPAISYSDAQSMIIFAGKGGVGKTTLAAATALSISKHHPASRILLYSTDPAHSLTDIFNQPIGAEPRQITKQLFALEIDAMAEFEQLKVDYENELEEFWGSISDTFDLTFDREVMERLLDLSPPGIDEIMALTLATEYLSSSDFDLFIMDSAPTGHLIRLLKMPELVDEWLKHFFRLFLKYKQVFKVPKLSQRLVKMSKELKYLRKVLTDAVSASLIAVTVPTEMALEETRDLIDSCRQIGIKSPAIFLNLATPDSECPFCSEMHRYEEMIKRRYKDEFPDINQKTINYRGSIKDLNNLEKLGECVMV